MIKQKAPPAGACLGKVCMRSVPYTGAMPQPHARTAVSTDADLPAGPAAAAAPAAPEPLVPHAPARASTRQGLSQHPPAVSAGQGYTQPAFMRNTPTGATPPWGPAATRCVSAAGCLLLHGIEAGAVLA